MSSTECLRLKNGILHGSTLEHCENIYCFITCNVHRYIEFHLMVGTNKKRPSKQQPKPSNLR